MCIYMYMYLAYKQCENVHVQYAKLHTVVTKCVTTSGPDRFFTIIWPSHLKRRVGKHGRDSTVKLTLLLAAVCTTVLYYIPYSRKFSHRCKISWNRPEGTRRNFAVFIFAAPARTGRQGAIDIALVAIFAVFIFAEGDLSAKTAKFCTMQKFPAMYTMPKGLTACRAWEWRFYCAHGEQRIVVFCSHGYPLILCLR